MILKRGVKIQLIAFALITIIGITTVSVKYIGFGKKALGQQYFAYVDLSDSGGVFTNAEVTYRGVPVGRVGPIQLTQDGIKVKLLLDKGHRIPRDGTSAIVANRSAVGEQYIDLEPSRNGGPYLDQGRPYTIPRQQTRIPVSTEELLRNVDQLVGSVDPKNLGTIVDELDKAFSGTSTDLQKILDDTDRILKTADKAYPDTKALLDNGRVVLDTQAAEGANIRGFARNLNSLSATLRDNDGAIRDDIAAAPGAITQADGTIKDLAPTLPVMLANLTTTGQIIAARRAGLRSLMILYPVTLAGVFTVMPGDGTQHLGLALNIDSPPPCTQGYEKTPHRWPQDTRDRMPDLNTGCKAAHNAPTDVRGARNFPKDALEPTPKVPPGATSGAGFPAGGASGRTSDASAGKGGDDRTSAAGSGPATSPMGQLTGVNVPVADGTVELAGYDPSTGVVYGPDGRRYGLGNTGGQQRLLGDASWKMLLLGPLMGGK
ncbi:MCE family protein [Actinomadura harenae]|uniref:MCE family protein n=1 Tax=Actinomadura harenae TaxID=2483351 RepID=A0A3M2MDF0_9ACTN|nr:MlaD family protein [Actinomadura harenae]RMI47541.1 MCE family protein [Actinomadura harenae]